MSHTNPEDRMDTDRLTETEDETLKRKEKKRKARLRKRGPYRKAHINW